MAATAAAPKATPSQAKMSRVKMVRVEKTTSSRQTTIDLQKTTKAAIADQSPTTLESRTNTVAATEARRKALETVMAAEMLDVLLRDVGPSQSAMQSQSVVALHCRPGLYMCFLDKCKAGSGICDGCFIYEAESCAIARCCHFLKRSIRDSWKRQWAS